MNSSYPPTGILLIYRTLRFAFLAFVLVFLLSSCSKTEQATRDSRMHDPKYDMYYKILTFIETMDGKELTNPAIQPRTLYSPNDILEYLEGAMNLMYTDYGLTWEDYDVTIDTFTIPLSSGYAQENDVEDLFEEVRDSASLHFYGIEEEDKFPFLYDATTISVSSSLMTLRVVSRVGKVHRDYTPFGSTDYWSVFTDEGQCYPMSGSEGDAASRISEALYEYFRSYSCVFHTNVTQVSDEDLDAPDNDWGEINSNDPNPGDFIIDYRTYYVYCNTTNGDCDAFVNNGIFCLDPDEMNYYFQSIVGIYEVYMNESGLEHIVSEIGLYSYRIGITQYHKWLTTTQFGERYACDENIEYPVLLPVCCQ